MKLGANVENIDLFYDVASKVPKDDLILEQGVTKMKIELLPSFSFNLPLDVVFKLVSANKTTPLIKYNPARRQEKNIDFMRIKFPQMAPRYLICRKEQF